jgi:histidinol-phosphatase (PHP family)
MIDYHTHTPLCKHAQGSRLEYLRAAERAGLSEIGVSDHAPWPAGYDPDWRMSAIEFSDYKSLITEMRAIKSPVKVKYAVEADWVPGKMDELIKNAATENFDYIIGSIHYTDEYPFDNPDKWEEIWTSSEMSEWIWHRYFELMLDLVSSKIFNIIGHFDLPKKFGSICPDSNKIKKLKKEIFQIAADSNIAIEINTAGLRKPVRKFYPEFDILRDAAKSGVLLTFGSDAHAPDEVGADFAEAIQYAKEAGFSKYCSFTERKHKTIKLP